MEKESSALGVIYFLLTSLTFSLIPVHQLPRPTPFPVSHPCGLGLIQEAEVTASAEWPDPPSPACPHHHLLRNVLVSVRSAGDPCWDPEWVALRESWGGPCPASENHPGACWHAASAEGAPLSPPFQLSGLFQLDDNCETCSAKSVLDTGESIRGEKRGDD